MRQVPAAEVGECSTLAEFRARHRWRWKSGAGTEESPMYDATEEREAGKQNKLRWRQFPQ